MEGVDAGLLILRVVLGLSLAAHGAQKSLGWFGGRGLAAWERAITNMRFRPAWFWARMSAWGELGGGLSLAAGLLTPFAAVPIICAMLVAMINTHWAKGFWNGGGGYEFNLLIIAASMAVGLAGPGRLSLDVALGLPFTAATFVVVMLVGLAGMGIGYATRAAKQPQPAATAGGSASPA